MPDVGIQNCMRLERYIMKSPKKRSVLKQLLIGFATIIAVLIALVVFLGIWLFPDKEDLNSAYHPFRSEQAKVKYLKFYDAKATKWPVNSKSTMIDTFYGKTFIRISGPDSSMPLVLLHGIGGNSFQWMPNIEALSENYKTYAIDNIYDNGRSVNSRSIDSADDFVS